MSEQVKIINNASHLVKDLIQGDTSVSRRRDFTDLENSDIKEALALLLNRTENLPDIEKYKLLTNAWKIHYRQKPPTIEEFLTNEWIGPMADNLYPHVKDILTEYYNPYSDKRHLILATSIGTGKSTLSTLWSLFVSVQLWCMRDPKKFFGLATSTSLVHLMISFTLEKAKQLLLQPFYTILLTSPKFRRVKMEELLGKRQEEYPESICWTSAGKVGQIQFFNDVHYVLASSPANVLGLNVISAILSEISFFLEKGFSTEYISKIYAECKGRVYSRFHNQYLSGTVIDSSPNDIELSPIDKYIFEGFAHQNPLNYVVTGPQWNFLPHNFPTWQKTGETFPVFRGESGAPPEILTPDRVPSYRAETIFHVPIDVKQLFKDDIIKSVKDYCGYPGGSQGTLIRDDQVVEHMFVPDLHNVYSFIKAPDSKPPEGLIWNAIADKFFIKFDKGYEFYRNPLETRYLHLDQAETGDMASISMVHPELNEDGDIIYVTDFTIAISPERNRINLNAIRVFIEELVEKGRMVIGKVTFDRYESSNTISYLKDKGIPADRLSVDTDIKPYRLYINFIQAGKIVAGKNIFLKNNLKSLQEIRSPSGKRKIDHTKGKVIYYDGGDWNLSEMGKFAKDVSDSHCGAVWNAEHHFNGVPKYQYIRPKEVKKGGKPVPKRIEVVDRIKEGLAERYGFAPRKT